jgi:lipopolysaccharide export system permease protein
MLPIIDRYIIMKFLKTFFFMMGVIMLLAVVFDLSERLSEFISNDAPLSAILFEYYLNFILYYGNLFSSLIIFVSVIWFTAKMAQNSEIIPIWNSGRSFLRFLRPYFFGATILMVLSLFMNHFVLPKSNKVRLQFEENFYRESFAVEDYHAEYPGNQIVYFSSFYSDEEMINDFVIEQWDKENKKLISFLKARTAYNEPNTNNWKLTDYYIRKVGYPKDILIEGKQMDTVFNFRADEMTRRINAAEAMDYNELKRFIDREKQKGSGNVSVYEIELYQRTSYPFAAYVLTIIGVAVSSKKKRGGIGVSIAIGLGIIFIYIFAMKVTTVAAIKVGFPSYIAVWVPNVLFGLIAYLLYRSSKR